MNEQLVATKCGSPLRLAPAAEAFLNPIAPPCEAEFLLNVVDVRVPYEPNKDYSYAKASLCYD